MSSKKPSIPALLEVEDDAARAALDALRENIEIITGRRGTLITKLGATATTSAIIQKINEIIDRLQT